MLEEYEDIIYKMRFLVDLFKADERVKEQHQKLEDEIKNLEESSKYLYDGIKEYDDNLGDYIYLDKGHAEARNRFVKALILKKK